MSIDREWDTLSKTRETNALLTFFGDLIFTILLAKPQKNSFISGSAIKKKKLFLNLGRQKKSSDGH